MATVSTSVFFETGTPAQFEYVLSKYEETLRAKAESKSSKPETLIKLDQWYQKELPKKIKSRGKEAHLTHEEIVQCIKWKLARGVFRPRLKDLVQMNTPRVVMQETKKAFRHLQKQNLEAAVAAMSNLKGVGPAMASAVLAAGAPELAPFMADECLMALPDMEGIDYTMKEYMKLVEKTRECVERLNSQGGSWTPHKVELAVWTHYVARDIKPELLDGIPTPSSSHQTSPNRLNGNSSTGNSDSTPSLTNGEAASKQTENGGQSSENNSESEASKEASEAEDSKDGTESNGTTELTGAGSAGQEETEEEPQQQQQESPAVVAAVEEEAAAAVVPREEEEEDKENHTDRAATTPAHNGTEAVNGEAKQEASKDSSCESQKRPLEATAAEDEEEAVQSEPKRIKDDLAAAGPPAIPAGGE